MLVEDLCASLWYGRTMAGLLVWPQIEFDRQGNGQGAAAGEGQQGPDGRVHFGQHNHPTFWHFIIHPCPKSNVHIRQIYFVQNIVQLIVVG